MQNNQTKLPEAIKRISNENMDSLLGKPFNVLDAGFIRVIDYMGDQSSIVQAARVSYGLGTESASTDEKLIRYLMRHRHTTPFEMCEIKLHVKLPIFVARQWVRHRTASINEYSARYSILAREFFIPDVELLGKQSTANKQGRGDSYSEQDARWISQYMNNQAEANFDMYDYLISDAYDLARETARQVLPLSTYTEWYWKTDLHNLLHFCKLRADPHAQEEIRKYAMVIESIILKWMPVVFQAYLDYIKTAKTFSYNELILLRELVAVIGFSKCKEVIELHPVWNLMSKREQKEFLGNLEVQ